MTTITAKHDPPQQKIKLPRCSAANPFHNQIRARSDKLNTTPALSVNPRRTPPPCLLIFFIQIPAKRNARASESRDSVAAPLHEICNGCAGGVTPIEIHESCVRLWTSARLQISRGVMKSRRLRKEKPRVEICAVVL